MEIAAVPWQGAVAAEEFDNEACDRLRAPAIEAIVLSTQAGKASHLLQP